MGALYAFDILDLVLKYKTDYYVETGTGEGLSLQHALRYPFIKYISVDIDEDLVTAANEKFSGSGKDLEIFACTSEEMLREKLPEIPGNSPVFFFLDAHFPGADFHKMSYEESIRTYQRVAFPLEDEIEIIKSVRDTYNDVFIIDDLFLYEPEAQYEAANWNYRWLQDELNLATNSAFIYRAFQKTHDFAKDYRHQGYLTITPKNKD